MPRSVRWTQGSLVIDKRMIIKIIVAVLVPVISIGANHAWSMYHHDTGREDRNVKTAAEERILAHVKKEIDRLEENLIRLQNEKTQSLQERLTRQEERFGSQEEIFRSQEKKVEKLQSYVDLRVKEKTTDAVEGLKEKIKHTETVLKDNLGHHQKKSNSLDKKLENLKEEVNDMNIDLKIQINDENHHHNQHSFILTALATIVAVPVIIFIAACCFAPVVRLAIGN